jgi:hypothetical protein
MVKKIILLYILGLLIVLKGYSQDRPPNIPYFDDKTIHFGFILGYNSLYSNMVSNQNFPHNDTIMGFNADRSKGFQIGVISDLRLLSFVHLRLTPTISFADRLFTYDVADRNNINKIHQTKKDLEVIYLEAPLELKVQSKRWRDFRPYLIGGMKYVYDLGSIKRKKLNEDEFLMKIDNQELMYTLGVGFDFYLEYFKFGVELKSSFGLNDILDHNFNNAYTDCIDKIKSQIFYINLTFE